MNKAAVIKKSRENKDKTPYDLLAAKIITEEEYQWLLTQGDNQAAAPTVKETKAPTQKEINAQKAENPQPKPVTIKRIDTMQQNNIVSVKPKLSRPKQISSTAMAILRHKVSGKEKPMMRVAAERMVRSNPSFYEIIN